MEKKKISVYFGAVTSVKVGHIEIDDDKTIEDVMKEWIDQGFARVHYLGNKHLIYIPVPNIVYCQYG
jgi:hypothetical protein